MPDDKALERPLAGSRPAAPAARPWHLFPWRGQTSKTPARAKGKTRRSSDIAMAGLGIALCAVCALFPWYIFFNQNQFGVRAMRFEGKGPGRDALAGAPSKPTRIGATAEWAPESPDLPLDFFPTGTLPQRKHDDSESLPGIAEQPFPGEVPVRLLHVANGRAMVEDDTGMFLVQRGSILPDNSRVAAIEQRSGKWVIVTTAEHVIEMAP